MGIQEGKLRCWKGTRPEPRALGSGLLLAPNLLYDLRQVPYPFWANKNNKSGNNQNVNIVLGTIY